MSKIRQLKKIPENGQKAIRSFKDDRGRVITKEVNGKNHIYRDEQGNTIHTSGNSLDWIVAVNFFPLQAFLDADGGPEDGDDVRLIAKTLLERAMEKFEKASNYIEKNYGIVEIEKAVYHQSVTPETMLDIVFKPPLSEEEKNARDTELQRGIMRCKSI